MPNYTDQENMNDSVYSYAMINISPLPTTFISITGNVMTF